MNISVDLSLAREFRSFLSSNFRDREHRECFRKCVMDNRSFQLQMKFHRMSPGKYFTILFGALDGKSIPHENQVEMVMANSFEYMLNNREVLLQKLQNVCEYDFLKLENKLAQTLPANTVLNADIGVVLDGFNAGSIVDSSHMLLDVLFWPAKQNDSGKIEGIVLHEFHHLGVLYWLENNQRRNQLQQANNGVALAAKLVENIMGEGAATYFFNQDVDVLVELMAESYGPEIAKQFGASVGKATVNIATIMTKFNKDLDLLMREEDTFENMQKITRQYGFSVDYGQPLDKTLGVHMCSVIAKYKGPHELIEVLKDPGAFLDLYNRCARELEDLPMDNRLIGKWNEVWS